MFDSDDVGRAGPLARLQTALADDRSLTNYFSKIDGYDIFHDENSDPRLKKRSHA